MMNSYTTRLVVPTCAAAVCASGGAATGMVRLTQGETRALVARGDLVIGEDTDPKFSVWPGRKVKKCHPSNPGLSMGFTAGFSRGWRETLHLVACLPILKHILAL